MTKSLTLLQIGNAPRLVGGTAACIWTAVRALPQLNHRVLFLGNSNPETSRHFPVPVNYDARPTTATILDLSPDLILLHNVAPHRVNLPSEIPVVQYVHSAGKHAPAAQTVYCSRWLANQLDAKSPSVLLQAVPKPTSSSTENRTLREELIVGRICTPDARKWPPRMIDFYQTLARQWPRIQWEFVGCPASLQQELAQACAGQVRFFPASWTARTHLCRWDALLYSNPQLPESFGRTVAESMRAGCIPIVDHQGGFIEQLADGGGCTCRTEEEFASSLSHLIDPLNRRHLSLTAELLGDERFSLRRFGKDLLRVFASAASS